MFTGADKAIVAFIMAGLVVIEQVWGWSLGLTEEWITSLIALIGAVLVWLVPNKEA